MACKNCTKNEVRDWFTSLGLVLFVLDILVGFIGIIVVWKQSWDGYDYEMHEYVTRYMNWVSFGIFGAMFVLGATTVVHLSTKEVQDK